MIESLVSPHRVLLIDDDPDTAGIFGEVLEELGQTVQVAHSGPEGLALAKDFQPDTVFCDIGLPGMSGYEIARTIRQDPSLRSVFLVAVSGYAQPDDVRRAKSAGFDRHLAKPSRIDDIERLLAEAPLAEAPPERKAS